MKDKTGYIRNTDRTIETLKWLQAIILAFITAAAIKGFVLEKVSVEGQSMKNTFSAGQNVIIYKLGYIFSQPARGDIVVVKVSGRDLDCDSHSRKYSFAMKLLQDPEEVDFVKRVIGLPGETVSVRGGYVYINGVILEEPYIIQGTTEKLEKPVKVPDGYLFLMGDNREDSFDSRDIGPVRLENIIGKVF